MTGTCLWVSTGQPHPRQEQTREAVTEAEDPEEDFALGHFQLR